MNMKGRLLNFGTVDICGRMFSKDCKISFPDKIPITIDFGMDPDDVVGYGKITRDDKGLKISAELFHEAFNDSEYNVGGMYTNIKTHYESDVEVIDECKLVCAALIFQFANKDLIIRRE